MKKILIIGIIICLLGAVGFMVNPVGAQEDISGENTHNVTIQNESIYIDGEEEPQLNFNVGETHKFNVDTPGYPFMLSADGEISPNSDHIISDDVNVTNRFDNRAATENGTITVDVTSDILSETDSKSAIYYKNSNVSSGGPITVIGGGSGDNGNILPVLIGSIGGIPYWLVVAVIGLTSLATYFYSMNQCSEEYCA